MYNNDVLVLFGIYLDGHYWKQFFAGTFDHRAITAFEATSGDLPLVETGRIPRPAADYRRYAARGTVGVRSAYRRGEDSHPSDLRRSRSVAICEARAPLWLPRRVAELPLLPVVVLGVLRSPARRRHVSLCRPSAGLLDQFHSRRRPHPCAGGGHRLPMYLSECLYRRLQTGGRNQDLVDVQCRRAAMTPVKRLGLNFGVSGDRKDAGRQLVAGLSAAVHGPLVFQFDVAPSFYSGGRFAQENSVYTDIQGDKRPWLFRLRGGGIAGIQDPTRRRGRRQGPVYGQAGLPRTGPYGTRQARIRYRDPRKEGRRRFRHRGGRFRALGR